jgi:Transcriptional activator of glycolytic enzymes
MTKELRDQKDPLDACLEQVLPGVHQWHRINNNKMAKLEELVLRMDGKLVNGIEQMTETITLTQQESDKQLAFSFLNIAQKLLERSGLSGGVPAGDMIGSPFAGNVTGITEDALMESVGGTPNPALATGTANENDADPADVLGLFRMIPKHLSLLDLVNEWFGTGDFHDEYGGIEGRNERYKSRWRKQCSINAMHYSRTERTVRAVEEYGKMHHVDKYVAAERLQHVYAIECKTSVTKFVLWAMEQGLIAKKGTRRKKGITSDQQDEQ